MEVVLNKPATGGFGFSLARNVISKVTPGGPAAKAGLQAGDRILAINDTEITPTLYLQMTSLIKKSGASVRLSVQQAGSAAAADGISASMQQTSISSPAKAPPAASPAKAPPAASPAKPAAATAAAAPAPAASSLPPPKPAAAVAAPTPAKSSPPAPRPAAAAAPPTPKPAATPNAAPRTPPDSNPSSVASEPVPSSVGGDVLCHACKAPVEGTYVTVQDLAFHGKCFSCVTCNKALQGKSFTLEMGKPMCQQCWSQSAGLICAGCDKVIVPDPKTGRAEYTCVQEQTFHKNCLRCMAPDCGLLFGVDCKGPYSVGGQLLCFTHAQAKTLSSRPEEDEKIANLRRSSRGGWR